MAMTPRESLLELCSDHFHGLISTDTYRQRRAEILDNTILGGRRSSQTPRSAADAAVPPSEPGPPVDAPGRAPRQAPAASRSPASVSPPAPAKTGRTGLLWIGGGVGALVVVAAAALWLGGSEPAEPEAAPEAAPAASPVAEAPITAEHEGGTFIDRFVAADVWDEAALSEFLYEWDLLGDAQREAVRSSMEFRALDKRIQGRLLELRALADASVPASVDRVRLVVSFARELGLSPEVGDVVATRPAAPKPAPTATPVADTAPPTATPGATTVVAEAPVAADERPAAHSPAEPASSVTTAAPVPAAASAAAPAAPLPTIAASAPAAPVAPAPSAAPAAVPAEKQAPAAAAIATQSAGAAIASARPCRREVAEVVPLPPANRRSCFDNVDADLRGPLLLILPPGQFTQGSNEDKAASPARVVSIPAPFALSVYEISVAEYRAFCGATQHNCAQLSASQDDFPVVDVSWHDAKAYAAWLGERTGARYRLPSEAEWEYAARAGTTTRYPFGDDVNQAQAVYAAGAITGPLPRSKSVVPNEFGLRHMVGNVAEWVEDVWMHGYAGAPSDGSARAAEGDDRVVRGGSFTDSKGEITSAARRGSKASARDSNTGFRVVREL